jgi:SAM-dependent methyltransferase
MSESPEHVLVNRQHWNDDADSWVSPGERGWAAPEPNWGIWAIPESELDMLPDDMSGMEAIELGCGTGYVSGWMVKRGASVVGLDVSERQLATARRLATEHEVALSLIHADAEKVPFVDESFDFAISEYGAALWTDPYVWIPEAYRILRPGGRLVFLSNSTLSAMCSPVDGSLPLTERLERDYFTIHRLDWRNAVDEPGGIEFILPISKWFRLFTDTGFAVTGFEEIQAPHGGSEVNFYATADWAHRYPSEQVWKLHKPAP